MPDESSILSGQDARLPQPVIIGTAQVLRGVVRYTLRPRIKALTGVETESLEKTVDSGLEMLGLDAPTDAAQQLVDFLHLIEKWNKVYNLTAIREPGEMVHRHLMDSLAILPWLNGRKIADVGSGGGLPGIPLAVMRPDIDFTLIDSSGKKTRFLRHAARKLTLDNVQIARCRVEDYDDASAFDTVISRAFAAPGDFVHMAGHLCGPGGRLLAMTGVLPPSVSDQLPEGWSIEGAHKLEVPGLVAERHILLLVPDETE